MRLVTPAECAADPDCLAGLTRPEHRHYLRDFLLLGPRLLVGTCELERAVVVIGGRAVPLVVNDGREQDCYAISPYAHYVRYMLLELHKIRGAQARLLERAVALLGRVVLPLGFNRCVSVNNWLLTTNPELTLDTRELEQLTDLLSARYPDLPLVIRSVDARSADVRRRYQDAGYALVINRPVHEWDWTRARKKQRRAVRHDIGLLDDPRFSMSTELAEGEEFEIARLYSSLYHEKHGGYNCRYSARFFRVMHDCRMMRFVIMRQGPQIRGFMTTFDDGARTVAALIGYDTTLDQRQYPLYRSLFAYLLRSCIKAQRVAFLSTGAATFKLRRGSYEWLEHEAVYARHLPRHKRAPWAVFKRLLDATVSGLNTADM